MRALDSWAIDGEGVPSLDLMERAGAEAARAVTEMAPAGPVRAVCGKGNNGGDGLVVTRLLRERGIPAEALLLWPADELSGDARANHERLVSGGGSAVEVGAGRLDEALAGSALVVDAILGTGFEGSPRAPVDAAIGAINGAGCPVVAVDVPSGVNATTGEAVGPCVRAQATVTFHGAKVGLWISPGKQHAGRVEVAGIGVPAAGRPEPPSAGLIAREVLEGVPRRTAASNKFSAGTVLVVGGSTGLTGAACLACEGAMRAGAGWVRAAVPASLNPVFEVKLTEVMTVPAADREGRLVPEAAAAVHEAAERADAVVLGPGIGRDGGTVALAADLIARLERPLVVDADGLYALARVGLDRVASRAAPTVLTPHAGELARLLGVESAQVSARRLASAGEAADLAGATVVLKGDDTLVVEPSSAGLGVSEGDCPGLATAGTGDVLSGVIAAFLAKGLGPFAAACAGVRAHADAGRAAAERLGADSVVAGDVVAALPGAIRGSRGAAS
jgi:NAD(P)H-hydrate epimerase